MKQALIFAEEIARKEDTIRKTQSLKLKRDYKKSIKRSYNELRKYCKAKQLDFEAIVNTASYNFQFSGNGYKTKAVMCDEEVPKNDL